MRSVFLTHFFFVSCTGVIRVVYLARTQNSAPWVLIRNMYVTSGVAFCGLTPFVAGLRMTETKKCVSCRAAQWCWSILFLHLVLFLRVPPPPLPARFFNAARNRPSMNPGGIAAITSYVKRHGGFRFSTSAHLFKPHFLLYNPCGFSLLIPFFMPSSWDLFIFWKLYCCTGRGLLHTVESRSILYFICLAGFFRHRMELRP